MEAIQNSLQALTETFNSQMEEFQKNLQGAIPATSPTSNIASQFNAFRAFVLAALAGLQQQVTLLASQTDQMEMRSRRKMLLLHGIPEHNDNNLTATVSTALSNHLKVPDLNVNCFSRCQRLGKPKGDKPRPILLKFHNLSTRNQVWFSKTALKNSGITLSEFLTKGRHDAFVAARQKFGITKCWTRDGLIIISGHDGKRHRATSTAEVKSITMTQSVAQTPASTTATSTSNVTVPTPKVVKPSVSEPPRSKRIARK